MLCVLYLDVIYNWIKIVYTKQNIGIVKHILSYLQMIQQLLDFENRSYQRTVLIISYKNIKKTPHCSFWIDTINLVKCIVHNEGYQVIIFKQYCIFLFEDLFLL